MLAPSLGAAALLLAGSGGCGDQSPHAGEAPAIYTPVERARSDPAASLTWSKSVAADRWGNIFVPDLTTIHVFAANGTLLRSLGRQGMGPGEFDKVVSVEMTPGDSVYAFDAGLSRVTVFEPRTWRTAYTVQLGQNQLFAPFQVRRVPGSHAIAALFEAAYGDEDGRTPNARRKAVVRLLNDDGSLRKDSVLVFPEREQLILHNPDGVSGNPFGRNMNVALASGGRMVAEWSDSLQFGIYSLDGRRVRTVRPRYAPPRRPITRQERDSVVAGLANELVPEAAYRRAIEEHGATTWPLVRGMFVDDRDRVWMGITGLRGEPDHWTAFDLRGERVAQVDLPGNVSLRAVRGNTAYAFETDGNDVPRVVVYDLRPTQTLALNRR